MTLGWDLKQSDKATNLKIGIPKNPLGENQ